MIVQVGIAVRQLEKLRVECPQTAVSALFVRWTIHNWNMQGPFNEEAYCHTLAMPLGTAVAVAHEVERCVETVEKQENVVATCPNMTRKQTASAAVQAPVIIEGEMMDAGAMPVQLARTNAAEETEAHLARRMSGKGRWRPLDATPFDSQLGHVSGAGSVIINASRPASVVRTKGSDRLPLPSLATASHDDVQQLCKRARKSYCGKAQNTQDARYDIKAANFSMRDSSFIRADSSSTAPPASPLTDTLNALSTPTTMPPSPEQHRAVAAGPPDLRARTRG